MQQLTYKDINIVYEDNHLLVVVKPQNVPVCPDESGDLDLLSLLKEYVKVTYKKPGDVYLGLVHRLDRVTGGVMVFAKTSKSAARLSADIQAQALEKRYLAVLVGVPKDREGNLVHYLLKDEANNVVRIVPMATNGAKRAELSYQIVDTAQGLSLADIKLMTGRSHQIRVQFSALNTPVFGDAKYGGEKTPRAPKIALWAAELRLAHPTTKEVMLFRVYPPNDEIPWKLFHADTVLDVPKPSPSLYDSLNVLTDISNNIIVDK